MAIDNEMAIDADLVGRTHRHGVAPDVAPDPEAAPVGGRCAARLLGRARSSAGQSSRLITQVGNFGMVRPVGPILHGNGDWGRFAPRRVSACFGGLCCPIVVPLVGPLERVQHVRTPPRTVPARHRGRRISVRHQTREVRVWLGDAGRDQPSSARGYVRLLHANVFRCGRRPGLNETNDER